MDRRIKERTKASGATRIFVERETIRTGAAKHCGTCIHTYALVLIAGRVDKVST